MTKTIQQVKQDLENLKATTVKTANELEQLHRDYLDLLNRSLKQQLILACYQICTELYPEPFLNLSLNQKQQLQQNLRQLARELEPKLTEIIEQRELEPQSVELNLMAELIKNLPQPTRKSDEGNSQSEENQRDNSVLTDLELVKAELENIELIAIDTTREENEESLIAPEPPPKEQIDFENPEHLILWHKQIQRGVKQTLDSASRNINKIFQESEIIPNRLPSKVIDIAMQADSVKGGKRNQKLPHVPHVLHLAIETDKDNKSKSSSSPIYVSLLRLRLAELEFYDPLLNAKRGQMRNLMSEIKDLNNSYEAIKRETAVIEAQAAWRSSWYED